MIIFVFFSIFISFAIHTFLSLKKDYSSEKRPKSPKKRPKILIMVLKKIANILIIFFKIIENILIIFSKIVENNFKTVLMILLNIIIFRMVYIHNADAGPLLCDHFDDLSNGTINRNHLLLPGQTIKTLPHGSYRVTGGLVHIGHLGGGHVTKVIGITVDGNTGVNYIPGTQPFNRNFASVLYELLQAGQTKVSYSCMDTIYTNNRELVTPHGNFHAHFLQTFRAHAGMNPTEYGETSISARIINGIAR